MSFIGISFPPPPETASPLHGLYIPLTPSESPGPRVTDNLPAGRLAKQKKERIGSVSIPQQNQTAHSSRRTRRPFLRLGLPTDRECACSGFLHAAIQEADSTGAVGGVFDISTNKRKEGITDGTDYGKSSIHVRRLVCRWIQPLQSDLVVLFTKGNPQRSTQRGWRY